MASKTTGKKTPKASPSKARSPKASSGRHARPTSQPIKKKKKPIPLHINAKSGKDALKKKNLERFKASTTAITGPSVKGGKPIPSGKTGSAGSGQKDHAVNKGKKGRAEPEAPQPPVPDAKGYVFINGRRVRMISIKGQLPIKKSRSNGEATNVQPTAEETAAIRAIKTKLSRKELNEYRELLLTKRRELVGDLHAMENEALRSGGGNLSHMPIHMADIGTDTFDQDFMLGLAANERDQLREIDAALHRIEDRTYGVCQMTGKPIPKARLDAKPWAKYTIEAARKAESQMPV